MISFVVPAYNEEALIGECIRSIIAEAVGDYEIIVVDNGSTDLTVEIAIAYGATKVIVEPVKGVVRARQAGFLAARGELVAFIDADSRIATGWINIMFQTMSDDRVVMCSGPLVFTDLNINRRIMTAAFYSVGAFVSRFFPMGQGGNCVMRRAALARAGGFDTSVEFYGEDTMTAIIMARVGRVRFVPGLFIWSSGRRMEAEGFVRIGLRYMVNFVWMTMTGKAWTNRYADVRPPK